MENKEYGVELAVVRTVFLYRLNVALAAILIFINAQTFISTLLNREDVPPQAPLIFGLFLAVCLAYGFLFFNGMLAKITVYEFWIEYKSLLQRRYLPSVEIETADFHRKDQIRMKIILHVKDGKPMIINTAKYKDNKPIIDFCAKFKKD